MRRRRASARATCARVRLAAALAALCALALGGVRQHAAGPADPAQHPRGPARRALPRVLARRLLPGPARSPKPRTTRAAPTRVQYGDCLEGGQGSCVAAAARRHLARQQLPARRLGRALSDGAAQGRHRRWSRRRARRSRSRPATSSSTSTPTGPAPGRRGRRADGRADQRRRRARTRRCPHALPDTRLRRHATAAAGALAAARRPLSARARVAPAGGPPLSCRDRCQVPARLASAADARRSSCASPRTCGRRRR